jgi:hypothetical protein
MKKLLAKLLSISFFFSFFSISAQQITVTPLADLSSIVYESSGLIYLNGKIITHNDEGNLPILYEIDSTSQMINRQVVIANASYNDWEDICFDSTFIYIAEFGNNHNDRTDLRVFRISINDYFNTPNDTVFADTISFSYSDQFDFSFSVNQTNFDAETLISYKDSLYIFTKNWNNERSNIYSLPKQPGDYLISRIDSFNSNGLITGGDYNTLTNEVILIGYKIPVPFVIKLSQYSAGKFSNGIIEKEILFLQGSPQVEGITVIDQYNYFFSAEESIFGNQKLYKLTYANPTSLFNVAENKSKLVKVTDMLGQETSYRKNTPLFYIYDDGTVKRRITLD